MWLWEMVSVFMPQHLNLRKETSLRLWMIILPELPSQVSLFCIYIILCMIKTNQLFYNVPFKGVLCWHFFVVARHYNIKCRLKTRISKQEGLLVKSYARPILFKNFISIFSVKKQFNFVVNVSSSRTFFRDRQSIGKIVLRKPFVQY